MLVPALLAEEHEALRDSLRGLLARRCTPESRQRTIDANGGHDAALWTELVRQLELPGLTVPEEYGGAGFGPFEAFLVAAELGRVLAPTPYFSVAGLATNLLMEAGTDEARRTYLPPLSGGSMLATAGISEGDDWSPRGTRVQAEAGEVGYRLTGTKRFVTDGATADLLLVTAVLDGRLALLAVDTHQAHPPRVEPLTTLDLTRPQAHVHLVNTPAQLISEASEDCGKGVQRALDLAALVLIGEACGAAERLLESAREYAQSRIQFGRPIGGFQAIKHKLADMAFDHERMWTAGLHAARSATSGRGDPAIEICVARAFCAEAYFRIAAEHIQVHGGIGFTWEHEAHLYFRHAKSLELLLGTPAQARERLISLLEAKAG